LRHYNDKSFDFNFKILKSDLKLSYLHNFSTKTKTNKKGERNLLNKYQPVKTRTAVHHRSRDLHDCWVEAEQLNYLKAHFRWFIHCLYDVLNITQLYSSRTDPQEDVSCWLCKFPTPISIEVRTLCKTLTKNSSGYKIQNTTLCETLINLSNNKRFDENFDRKILYYRIK
jgi:hypothetical protein